jgi:transposase
VRCTKMLARALGVERGVVENVREEDGVGFVVRVRPRREHRQRCPYCAVRCPGYDAGAGARRWRTHDLGLVRAFIEAQVPRVECAAHGVVVAYVPWARHGSGFTSTFENTIAWLAVRTDKTTLSGLMRIAWRTVGAIVERVCAEARESRPPLVGIRRIGVDEVSYRKGHRYLTVVVDHDTGRLLWAQPGRDEKTLREFFQALGADGRAAIQLVSADAAAWIGNVVREQCPQAILCIDPFHVVAWATKAVDEVRRTMWNELRERGESDRAKALKGSRWTLVKNPEDLTRKQKQKLRAIEADNLPLFHAYVMKEQLRDIFRTKGALSTYMLDAWLEWVDQSKIAAFNKVARAIRANRVGIDSALRHGLSNARVESMNTKLKLLTRMAFGFHSHHPPLIALAMLKLGGLCPTLPRAT